MKTTFDLPPELVRQLKLRAVQDGRKLKDLATDLLRHGLAASTVSEASPVVKKDKFTGLPVIQCRRAPRGGQHPTPEQIAAILSEQEVEWMR
jgi:hypothetical protein